MEVNKNQQEGQPVVSSEALTLYVDDQEPISVDGHAKVRDLVDIVLGHGEAGFVFVEEIEAPLGQELTLIEAGVIDESLIHIGRCRQVSVSVRYEGKTDTKQFVASATVSVVKRWAVGHFGVADPADHQLARPGEKAPLQDDLRVGKLVVGRECALSLDLRLFPRVQG